MRAHTCSALSLALRMPLILVLGSFLFAGCEDIQQARERGRKEGYREGYDAGKSDGLEEGDNKGYSRGETVGYAKGYASGSITFFHDHMIPSLGLALLTTAGLFVVWLAFRCVVIFFFPPSKAALFWAKEQIATTFLIRQGFRNIAKEKVRARAERSKLEAQEKVSTLLMEAGTAYKINLAKIEESKRAVFEQLFADLAAAVSEEKRRERREFDKKYSLMSAFIKSQKQLDPAAKLALERELLALYKKLIGAEVTT
jgi:hypothetical protein